MKKVLGLLVIAGVIMFTAPNSHAQETKDLQGIFEECGLGALLFPEWAVGASVSNFTWDVGTTASTSGLTTPESCKGGKARMAAYIFESYDSIEQDLAKGSGKYLDMLSALNETQAENKELFIAALRSEFQSVVANNDYSTLSRLEKAKLVYSIVEDLS